MNNSLLVASMKFCYLSVTSHTNCIVALCLINRIPGSCLLISSLPGSALRTHVESLGKLRDVNKRSQSFTW